MKDIKSGMIGFLLATCMFLLMGQTKATNYGKGKYQAFGDTYNKYIIDTNTGKMWVHGSKYHKPAKKEGSYTEHWWEEKIISNDFRKNNDK